MSRTPSAGLSQVASSRIEGRPVLPAADPQADDLQAVPVDHEPAERLAEDLADPRSTCPGGAARRWWPAPSAGCSRPRGCSTRTRPGGRPPFGRRRRPERCRRCCWPGSPGSRPRRRCRPGARPRPPRPSPPGPRRRPARPRPPPGPTARSPPSIEALSSPRTPPAAGGQPGAGDRADPTGGPGHQHPAAVARAGLRVRPEVAHAFSTTLASRPPIRVAAALPAARTSAWSSGFPVIPAARFVTSDNAQHLQPFRPGGDRLERGGHTHQVRTQSAQHPDLGRGLVVRPRQGRVDPLLQGGVDLLGQPPQTGPSRGR